MNARPDRIEAKINMLWSTFWLAGGAILIFASCWSVRFALADYFYTENTISSLTEAVALAGGDAEYRALLAEHLEGVGTDPDPLFLRAAALSPEDSRYWIRLGFSAETKGNYQKAEQYLLKGASVNRKFDPAWALMNFYFRRDEAAQFWIWADKALAMSYGDASAIFRLMWDMSDDARLIRSHVLPRRDLLAGYLYFLELNRHPEAARDVASDLASVGDAGDVQFLMQYCDQALAFDPAAALEVWNTMCRRKLLALPELNPARGAIVADPEFSLFPSTPGFGWRFTVPDGVTVAPAPDRRGIRIDFSANQPEDCVLIYTELPVQANSRYQLHYNSSYESGASISGLSWEVSSSLSGVPVVASADFPAGSGPGTVDFETHAEIPVRLQLRYRRPLGSVRARGAVIVESVRSELAP
jgi:tetratricopeptide (TPR) repeat protein